jgi:predicted patatin/cPLA2 family phospholipase
MTNTVDIEHPSVALIMSGGGARAAYQVGVLRAITRILPRGAPNPFRIVPGVPRGLVGLQWVVRATPAWHENAVESLRPRQLAQLML